MLFCEFYCCIVLSGASFLRRAASFQPPCDLIVLRTCSMSSALRTKLTAMMSTYLLTENWMSESSWSVLAERGSGTEAELQ